MGVEFHGEVPEAKGKWSGPGRIARLFLPIKSQHVLRRLQKKYMAPVIAISFDYDSPAGYRESFHMRDFPANADYEGTNILLKVLQDHDVKVTFGIVGQAALPGEKWNHCQEQIRAIRQVGHEIASHSMTHRYLPAMRGPELLEEVAASKRALEECIGSSVQGFIPPFNRPSHFPERGAFSLSEVLGLGGRGRGRQSVGTMLEALSTAGFGWSRVSFESKYYQLGRRLGFAPESASGATIYFQKYRCHPVAQHWFCQGRTHAYPAISWDGLNSHPLWASQSGTFCQRAERE